MLQVDLLLAEAQEIIAAQSPLRLREIYTHIDALLGQVRQLAYRYPNEAKNDATEGDTEERILNSYYAQALALALKHEQKIPNYRNDLRHVTQAITLWQKSPNQTINLAAFAKAYADQYDGLLGKVIASNSRFYRPEQREELRANIRLAKAWSDRSTRTGDIEMKQHALILWNKVFASIVATLGEIPRPELS